MTTQTLPITLSESHEIEPLAETRGYFLNHTKGFSSEFVRQEMERAVRAGFNLIIFPVYVNGYTLYPSQTAAAAGFAQINPLFKKWNPLAEAAEIAHDLGVGLWGLLRLYNFHPRHSIVSHRLLKRFPDWRLAIHPDFKDSSLRRRESYVACPVNRDYRRYCGDLLSELVSSYAIDGIVINMTGYGLRRGSLEESPFCFCDACRHEFSNVTRANMLAKSKTTEGMAQIRKWQADVSTETLEYLRHRVIKSRRTMRMVCRAQPQWRWNADDAGPALHTEYCINWDDLLGRGIVEELVVDHDEKVVPELFSSRLVSDLVELHHEALVLPQVGISHPAEIGPVIAAVRKYAVSGFVAQFDRPLTDEDADFIRREYLSAPAQIAESSPLAAAALLLRLVQQRHAENALVHDFMRDFVRLVERAYRETTSLEALELICDNLAGLRDAIRRGRLRDYKIGEHTLRDIGLARRLVRLACFDVRS